ncbi:PSD1 and planctomycete cytochrome C domain-containing protein [Planctomicrobium sp. SH661]|uniref:PSD1 and planctomycete cytochrome C domain-containing protein n=1 Tax=Planctomicrobium sp. SH661 TaxID=3448124 RepID=UPI003F5CA0D3
MTKLGPSLSILLSLLFVQWGMETAGTLCLAGEVDFGRDIRPILSDKCFQCHGADAGTRHADLRLDLRDAAIAERDGTRPITPHRPEESLILARILSTEESERMPPAESNKHLTADQIELLRQWIEQGAVYKEHWAFEPVQAPPIPAVRQQSWVRNEVDAFILERLERNGLPPSPEADRPTLIRRLYQDLIGLLPTPEETAAFVKDPSPDAYEQLVERLLRNPHYGERWGRHWLDQARYADSHGFTVDMPRTMWPYRDWVIQAVNQDLPFDQFTIEQLAGDLLPNPTKSQLVASAFHRNTMINQEGGVKPDQYRHEAIVDRVNTTGAVWLGLTIGCAQCHSHKFDPISHDDYYRLYTFFNSCVDANDDGPTIGVYQQEMFGLTTAQQAEIQELESLRQQLEAQEQQEKELESQATNGPEWNWRQAEITDAVTEFNETFQRLPDGSLLSNRNGGESVTYRVTIPIPEGQVQAIRLRVLPHESLPQNGPGLAENGNFVLTDAELEVEGKQIRFIEAIADHQQPGFPAMQVLDQDAKTGWAINVGEDQKQKTPDLAMNAPHELVLILEKTLDVGAGNTVTLVLSHHLPKSYVIGRFALDLTTVVPIREKLELAKSLKLLREQINTLEAGLPGLGRKSPQMIMRDMDSPPQTYRLDRGNFLQPDKNQGPLEPGVPPSLTKSLQPLPTFHNRLDLARWLVSRDNPLTARVTVNRIWMRYFGRGLVETENDFRFQSSPPTHPELLDWLAHSFMEQGWSMKAFHRKIVTSATYRQSSNVRADVLNVDPRNLLLAQQARFRVEAEIIRDMALSASGRLTPTIGGPSVHPPQPDGVYSFTQVKKTWPESQGADRYRRTLYTMLYRSDPHPLLSTFDTPGFSAACTQRPRSNTPLQSLPLANDLIFIELAQGLAQRALSEPAPEADLTERIDFLFRLCLVRAPDAAEQQVLERYWKKEQNRYAADLKSAEQVAPGPLFKEDQRADAAAWISLSRVLMNTDEFVNRK